MKKIYIIILAIFLSSCSTNNVEQIEIAPKKVQIIQVEKKTPENIEYFSAEILPISEVQISSKTSGKNH